MTLLRLPGDEGRNRSAELLMFFVNQIIDFFLYGFDALLPHTELSVVFELVGADSFTS